MNGLEPERYARVLTAAEGWSLLLATLDLPPVFRQLAEVARDLGPFALARRPLDYGLIFTHPASPLCDPRHREAGIICIQECTTTEMTSWARGKFILHAPHVWGGRLVFLVGPGRPTPIVTARLAPLALVPAVPTPSTYLPRRAS